MYKNGYSYLKRYWDTYSSFLNGFVVEKASSAHAMHQNHFVKNLLL